MSTPTKSAEPASTHRLPALPPDLLTDKQKSLAADMKEGRNSQKLLGLSRLCSGVLMQTHKAMRQRRETVEHPFGTMKARMGATHFLTKTLPKVAAQMALSVLAYNLTRVMNIVGIKPLMAAIVVA
jgi:IS5 family transposase